MTTYEAQDGAAAGDYAVVVKKIAVPTSDDGMNEEEGHSADGTGEMDDGGHDSQTAESTGAGNLVPQNYGSASSTPLSATVEEKDDNVFDFDIQ